ncbi:ATP-binding cassette domain-containing protein [Bacillus lacus]|uniref:Autoinducer 2 import ATP-binding protein LsrA n=1 Tax=Metabacillus lacus TaxID=1983721 RepID=A0A7X2J0Q5_9BACI|nr:sugar ABC transporter ATP-binding protein [Metabacillus lacus]MRX73305.1 ATP-binding cassette domain-containing protein [Metabacillus lacus]
MHALEMKQICKAFEENSVLKNVDFTVKKGVVHALLGMNGAGKSTLMKILSGDYQPDSGKIFLSGKEVSFSSPQDAKTSGIGILVQEVDTSLFPELPVFENLADMPNEDFLISVSRQKSNAIKLVNSIGLSIKVEQLVQDCSLQEKQLILLAKILSSSSDLIILDEPTAPLSQSETSVLFNIIKMLKKSGTAIIYISHRLSEIKEICDSVTILRDGVTAYTNSVAATDIPVMIKEMTGSQSGLKGAAGKSSVNEEKLSLKVRNLSIPQKQTAVDFTVHSGEIVGIAGLVGAGKTELAQALYGLSGEKVSLEVEGKAVSVSSPSDAISAGICLIPEERRRQGLFIKHSVAENITSQILKKLSAAGWVNNRKQRNEAEGLMKQLTITPQSTSIAARYLSGGNQQKVVIGKWLKTDSSVYLFDEPTKGIDIAAKQEVFDIIGSLAKSGKSILYFTSEWQELLEVADRILIMYNGKMVKELSCRETSLEEIIYYASGGDQSGTNRTSDNKETYERKSSSVSI